MPLPYEDCRQASKMNNHKETEVHVLLAEFSALRNEMLQKLSNSWTIFVFQLTTAGVVFSFSLTGTSRAGFLLIIPIVSYILASQYLRNLHGIRELATYIRNELSPRVPGGLKWEEWHMKRPNDRSIYVVLSPASVAFPGVSFIALALVLPYIVSSKHVSSADRWMLWLLWAICLAMTMMSLYMFQRLYRIRLSLKGRLRFRKIRRSTPADPKKEMVIPAGSKSNRAQGAAPKATGPLGS
jgi:hypothetical protein